MTFSGEDPLAVHTVVAAGVGIVRDLAEHRGNLRDRQTYENALREIYRAKIGRDPTQEEVERDSPRLRKLLSSARKKPANFLKHADRDPNDFLNEANLETDHILLEACLLYKELGFDLTTEMHAFGRWHLAVYPHEEGDALITADGPVHELSRESQLSFGAWLLKQSI